jgi:hypothetical protein
MTHREQKTTITFVHPSEESFARLLDFYRVRWEYEPRTFVLNEDEAGMPKECFTPDFYLPDYDLYIELTVRRGNINKRKHRKIALLKAAHPQVRIRLLHPRDFEKLMIRYGVSWRDHLDDPVLKS